jgi:hypothetical protein
MQTLLSRFRPILAGMALASVAAAQAADYTSFDTLPAWQAAAGSEVSVQTFQGYDNGALMSGVEFLPGVSATTSAEPLRIYENFLGSKFLFRFGSSGMGDVAHYDIGLNQPYRAVALDIVSFETDPGEPSTAAGPGTLTVSFADASSAQFLIEGNPTGTPVFFGITANQSITGIRWTEPLEFDGYTEETGIDNIRVAAVPEPASLAMLLLGLGVLGLRLRRG